MADDLTVRDIATFIRRPGKSLTAAVDKLRNWTDVGIIKAKGPKRPGTGHKRRYTVDAMISAGILQALVDATGSPAIAFGDDMGGMVEALRVLAKEEGSRALLLVVSRDPSAQLVKFDLIPPDELGEHISKSTFDVQTVIKLRRIYERLISQREILEAANVNSKAQMENRKGRRARSLGRRLR